MRSPEARRFELAHFIGDALVMGCRPETWDVSGDIPTEPQNRQGAFAAEFLCPAEAASQRLDGESSAPVMERIAERFGVSSDIEENLIENQYRGP